MTMNDEHSDHKWVDSTPEDAHPLLQRVSRESESTNKYKEEASERSNMQPTGKHNYHNVYALHGIHMSKTVRVDEEAYTMLSEYAGRLQTKLKRSISMNEAIKHPAHHTTRH